MNYNEWFNTCNNLIINVYGVGAEDFPDWRWMDAFQDAYDPAEAVENFISDMDIEGLMM